MHEKGICLTQVASKFSYLLKRRLFHTVTRVRISLSIDLILVFKIFQETWCWLIFELFVSSAPFFCLVRKQQKLLEIRIRNYFGIINRIGDPFQILLHFLNFFQNFFQKMNLQLNYLHLCGEKTQFLAVYAKITDQNLLRMIFLRTLRIKNKT